MGSNTDVEVNLESGPFKVQVQIKGSQEYLSVIASDTVVVRLRGQSKIRKIGESSFIRDGCGHGRPLCALGTFDHAKGQQSVFGQNGLFTNCV